MTSGNAVLRVVARLEALERRFDGFQSRFVSESGAVRIRLGQCRQRCQDGGVSEACEERRVLEAQQYGAQGAYLGRRGLSGGESF